VRPGPISGYYKTELGDECFDDTGFGINPILACWVAVPRLFSRSQSRRFWRALGVLLVARVFYSVLDGVGNTLVWRLLRRKQIIEATLATFKSLDFPMREYAADDVDAYLARIENDGNLPAEVRLAAHDLEFQLALFEKIGMIAGSRSRSAVEAAHHAYAKKFSAKEFHSNTAAER
jgi:hypothetical protein